MATITNHDTAFGSRVSTEPVARTVARVAGRGPLGSLTADNPIWYDDNTTLQTRTINCTGRSDKRRTGR